MSKIFEETSTDDSLVTVFTLETKDDLIVNNVINKFKQRSNDGQIKYGTTLYNNDLTLLKWIDHAQEEAMDFILYLESIKNKLNKEK